MTTFSEAKKPAGVKENWQRPFFLIWTGQAFSLLGSSIVQFAIIWWLTETQDSAIVLTMISVASMLPGVLLAPFAGALVDRWKRKSVMMIADGTVALLTVVMILLFLTGVIQVWHIYLIAFLRGLGGAFHWPAMESSTSLMVPAQHLSRIQGINQALNGMLFIAGPPLGALLVSLMVIQNILLIDVITAAIAVGTMAFVRIPQPAREASPVTVSLMLKDVREGFRYISSWKGAMMLLGIALLINFLLAPASVLLPLMVTREFNGGAMELGMINSFWAVGMVVGGLTLGAWGGFKSKIQTTLLGLILIGAGAAVMGLAPNHLFWVAVAGMAFMGFANPIANGPVSALLQERIAPEMQGRVFTLVAAGANIISPVAMIIAGPMAEILGLRFWYLLAAVACILLGTLARFSKDIMAMDQEARPVEAS